MRETFGDALLSAAGLSAIGAITLNAICSMRSHRRLYPRWASDCCVPTRRLCLCELLSLATQGRLSLFFGLPLALLLYLCAMGAYRMLSYGQTLASCAALCTILFFPALILYQNSLQPLRSLLQAKEFRLLLASWSFRYTGGAWQYADAEWFVRVGGGESCALRASALDFTIPPLTSTLPAFTAGARFPSPAFVPALLLRRRDGKKQIARIDTPDDLNRWFAAHVGRSNCQPSVSSFRVSSS